MKSVSDETSVWKETEGLKISSLRGRIRLLSVDHFEDRYAVDDVEFHADSFLLDMVKFGNQLLSQLMQRTGD